MKLKLISSTTLIYFVFLITIHAQSSDCESLLRAYQANTIGTNHPITDTVAFCRGATEAIEEKQLVVMSVGDMGSVSACKRYAYEYYGVKLWGTGDLISESDHDYVAGYNQVMQPRIRQKLRNNYDKLGKMQPRWYEFDENFLKSIQTNLSAEAVGQDSMLVKLVSSPTDSLDGIRIKSMDNTVDYPFSRLYEGITLPTWGKNNDRALVTMDYTNYKTENFCSPGYRPLRQTLVAIDKKD